MENSIWLIIGAYVVPSIVSLGTFLWGVNKDKLKAEMDKKQEEEKKQESDRQASRQDGELSLKWAQEFRTRLTCIEDQNDILRKQFQDLSILNNDLNVRIIAVERERDEFRKENELIKKDNEKLQREVTSLRKRVQELEDEAKDIKKGKPNV